MSAVKNNRLAILLVEDESFQRRIVRDVMKNLGFHQTQEADSGEAAVEKINEQGFDLILCDVQMPGMNGLELLRRIRIGQTALARDARFIILTSFSNTEVLGAAMALDVNGFLAKPIKIGVVMEKIDRAVQETFRLRAQEDYESVVTSLPSLDAARNEAALNVANQAAVSATLGGDETVIRVTQLRAGMYVTKALLASDGTLLIPAGTVLTDLFINRLRDLSSVLPSDLVQISLTLRPTDKPPE